jgi:CheY-like chemotaxis protein
LSNESEINSILVVENVEAEVQELVTKFKAQYKVVLTAKDDKEAREILRNVSHVDVVVLDIFLDSETDSQARIVLKYICDNYVIPVFIYTARPKESTISSTEYPNIIGYFDKSERIERVAEEIARLLKEAKLMRIGLAWMRSVSNAAHRTLIGLMPEWPRNPQQFDNALRLLLAGMRKDRERLMEGPNPDVEAYQLLEILSQGLTRQIIQDSNLIASVGTVIKESGTPDFGETGEYWRFREIIQFTHPNNKMLTTGDIFRDKAGLCAVLITPQCDLVDLKEEILCCVHAMPANTFLAEYKGSADKLAILRNATARYHAMMANNEQLRLILDFAWIFSVNRKELSEYEKIGTIASPFRENLVQRYVSYVNRIGTPVVPTEILKKILESGPAGQGEDNKGT